jgi:mannosyltransferase OCH1-like enzyme
MIPNIVHFNYGLMPQRDEFLFVYYIAVLSCKLINNPDKIYFYYHYEPNGYWWDKTKELVDIIKIDIPNYIGEKPLKKVAHKSDISRMQVLKKYGGIYLDIDTICIKSYKHLLNNNFFIGNEITESGKNMGLCNAIMGTEPEGSFITEWWDNYEEHFNPDGWQEASTFLPLKLSKINKNVTILKPSTFLLPSWEAIDMIFEKPNIINDDLIVLHYWNQYSIKKYLPKITNFDWVIDNSHTLYGKALLNVFSMLSLLENEKFPYNSLDEIINNINLDEFNKINNVCLSSNEDINNVIRNNLLSNINISQQFMNEKNFIGLKTYPVIMHNLNLSELKENINYEYKQINKDIGYIKINENNNNLIILEQNNYNIKISNPNIENIFYLVHDTYSNKEQITNIIIKPIITINDIKIMVTHKYIDSTHILLEIFRTDADWGWNKDLYLDITLENNNYLYYVGKNLLNYKSIIIDNIFDNIKLLSNYEQKIPKKIFQIWTKNTIELEMENTIKIIQKLNPEYEYKLFRKDDCIEYLKNNFNDSIINTFNNIVPEAFKADLFRYCVLFIEGGIYIDCKMIPIIPFRNIIKPDDPCVFVENTYEINEISICNGFMCSEAGDKLFLNCINEIVDNCINLYYPGDPFAVTGPTLLYNNYKKLNYDYRLLKLPNIGLHHTNHNNGIFNELNQLIIYKTYKNYYKNTNGGSYIKMFHLGNCYANIIDLLTVYNPINLKKMKCNNIVLLQNNLDNQIVYINKNNELSTYIPTINGHDGILIIICNSVWAKIAEIDLSQFTQIYIRVKTFFNEQGIDIQSKINAFKKINMTHKLIHAHGDNNYGTIEINNYNIPCIIGLTYLRSNMDTFELNKLPLPGELDTLVNIDKLDISLCFPPFVN